MKPLHKRKSPNFNYWVFITSSIVLLALSFLSLIWFQKQKETNFWISHTYEVKLKIEKCFGLLLEAESNQRGFVLTKDSTYLNHISHAESLLRLTLAQLQKLIADNKNQLENFKNLQDLILSRVARLHLVLETSGQTKQPVFSPSLSPGKEIMDSVHKEVKTMEAAEDALLGQRTFFRLTQDYRVITFIVLFSVLAFAILIWSFLKIKNESSLRMRAQMDAILLENLVNERTTEIKNMNRLLQDQNEKLERKNRDLTSFTHIASHDLKEPLRKIEMFTGRFIQTNPDHVHDASRQLLDKITYQTKRMQDLIESILKYAQTDDETQGFKQINLNETATTAMESLSEIIKEKNAIISIQHLPVIRCNPDQMTQVFINLLGNGLKYSTPGIPPHLEINATRLADKNNPDPAQQSGWKIDFCDNGIGFEETYAKKIFEIFQRLHSSDEYPGTGIGLAICKKIIDNHRGSITAKSSPGKGSVFSLILPSDSM